MTPEETLHATYQIRAMTLVTVAWMLKERLITSRLTVFDFEYFKMLPAV